MKKYIEIKKVPIKRNTDLIKSPVADIAARIMQDEAVELRLGTKNSSLYCYISVENETQQTQTERILKNSGYLFDFCVNTPDFPSGTISLIRKVETHNKIAPNCPPVQKFVIYPLISDTMRFECIYSALNAMTSHCGILMRIKKNYGLDIASYNRLFSDEFPLFEENVLKNLSKAPERFEISIEIYGENPANMKELLSEFLCAFPGLTYIKDDKISTLPANIKSIEKLYTSEEVNYLTLLDSSPENFGFPLNKDTIFGLPESFKTTKEDNIILGYSERNEPFTLPLKMLRKHLFLAGEPGAGKGNGIFFITQQLHLHNVPFLLIESAKKEQHHLAKVMPLKVWRASEGEFIYNPFQLPPNVKLRDYRASLLQTIRVCFKLDGPLEELFDKALNNCFVRYGYNDDSYINEGDSFRFGLSEFIEEYTRLLSIQPYSEKTKLDITTAGQVRLNTLFNENRGVFDTVNSLPVSELIRGENLLQLNCLPTLQSKQLFSTMLLICLSAYLRLTCNTLTDSPLRLVIILDESHNLLKAVNNNTSGDNFCFAQEFYNLLLELRSLGVGIIMADQSVNNIPLCLSEVCATKVFFGCSHFSGLSQYKEYFGADETALKHIHLLSSGEGVVTTYGMSKGAFIKTPNIIDKFRLNEEYAPKNSYINKNSRIFIETFRECKNCPTRSKCTISTKTSARQKAENLHLFFGAELLKSFGDKEKLNITMANVAEKAFYDTSSDEERTCTMIQFARNFNRTNHKKLDIDVTLKLAEHIKNEINRKRSK